MSKTPETLDEKLRERAEEEFLVIRSTSETDDETGDPLYWSNGQGWVYLDSATKFTQAEADEFDLPVGGYWV